MLHEVETSRALRVGLARKTLNLNVSFSPAEQKPEGVHAVRDRTVTSNRGLGLPGKPSVETFPFPPQSKNRKVYMLYEIEPSREITGGAWYTEQEFDAEFIGVLREAVKKFVEQREKVTLEEIAAFVKSSGATKVGAHKDCRFRGILFVDYSSRFLLCAY
jgi:hypothetical protein